MCQHLCKCGLQWSHQEFGEVITPSVTKYNPCPFPLVYDCTGQVLYDVSTGKGEHMHTAMCPHCYESESRKRRNGRGEVLSPREAIKQMDNNTRRGALTPQEIGSTQLEVETIFNMFVRDMNDEQLENHYTELLKREARARIYSLHFRRLKIDYDIEQMSKCSDTDRADFERLKSERHVSKSATRDAATTHAAKQNKKQKGMTFFVKSIMSANPKMTHEEALERAHKLYA